MITFPMPDIQGRWIKLFCRAHDKSVKDADRKIQSIRFTGMKPLKTE